MATKKIICTAMLTTLLFQSPSFASERLLRIGADSDGNPYFLDVTTMGRVEENYGKVISLYQSNAGSMTEFLLRPACGDEELWLVGTRVYSSSGIKLRESKGLDRVAVKGTGAGANAMRYYCKSIGARGW